MCVDMGKESWKDGLIGSYHKERKVQRAGSKEIIGLTRVWMDPTTRLLAGSHPDGPGPRMREMGRGDKRSAKEMASLSSNSAGEQERGC